MSPAAGHEGTSLLPTNTASASAANSNIEPASPSAASAYRLPSLKSLFVDGALLQNKGSTARDHLANERTYLAWFRTSLALIGASLGLLKWDAVSVWTGYLVAVVGVVCLINSTERYFSNMHRLEKGEFVPNVRGILVIVVVVVAAIVGAFVLHFMNQL